MSEETIFSKIIRREIPAEIVYEDDKCLAFKDVNPQAPVHILVIPKKPIVKLTEATEDDAQLLGHLMLTARQIAADQGYADDFRVVINNGVEAGPVRFCNSV
ncbi:MAG: histidine triad nucleotide-binding protein [Candidatus Parabeggiatoa sp. nov. 2]|nr:MAG: histidine triad nucleotide-binding protein [Beggiatoa sp. 4572_84]